MDGSTHSPDRPPSRMGHSIGKWEGDTLVVDTVGFLDDTWLDQVGTPHSDAMHLVERIRRPKPNLLEIEFTIDDPKAYTKTWSSRRNFVLQPGWEVLEDDCTPYFSECINNPNCQESDPYKENSPYDREPAKP
jgi:hypothetical protein